MLALTKRTEYALIALCHLARSPNQVFSARDIAERHTIKLPLLMNVLKSLNNSGLLQSIRGAAGGYRLAVDVDDISLARLIEAVEGPVRLVRCVSLPGDADEGHGCELMSSCPVRGPVIKIHQHLERFLESLTVASIAFDERYGVPASLGISGEPLKVHST